MRSYLLAVMSCAIVQCAPLERIQRLDIRDDVPALTPPTLPVDWMHANLPLLGCQPLRRICLPGSHDSGMSVLSHSTFLAIEENTLTQWTDIAGQLTAGIRYFDIRPVISAGQFVAGHYSKIGESWIGGNGQDIASMIEQINTFLSANNELVILDLSHIYNTDEDWRDINADEFSRLLTQLEGLENRYAGQTGPNGDLSALPLNNFIAGGPCVLIINSQNSLSMPAISPTGAFPYSALNIYNDYANTPLAPVMAKDQISKMLAQRTSRDSNMFLLSWTLTTPGNIRNLAEQAHSSLFDTGESAVWSTIYNNRAKGAYPNIIMVDGVGSTDSENALQGGKLLASLSMAVNSAVLKGVSCPA